MPITNIVRTILAAAAEDSDRTIVFPERLPIAAQRAVAQSMLKAGLIEEVEAEGGSAAYRATETGLAAAGITSTAIAETTGAPEEEHAAAEPSVSPKLSRGGLRETAQALLSVWDADPAQDRPALTAATESLRAKLAPVSILRQPRPDTKRAQVIALLSRPEGATVAQVVEATGWARHTVHGFFAGLKKAGIQIDVLERVRQVGAGPGITGSYTVYQVAA